MPASSNQPATTEVAALSQRPKEDKPIFSLSNPLATVEALLRRDEADILFIAGNVALAAFEIVDWPVAVLAIVAHAMARSRFKALEGLAEVGEDIA